MSAGALARPQPLAGVQWMLCAAWAIALVDALAKDLAADLHGVQVAWGYFRERSATHS